MGWTQYAKVFAEELSAVPASFDIMPKMLKRAGMSTHMLGKWHLGHFAQEYTPAGRGFDSYFGFLLGMLLLSLSLSRSRPLLLSHLPFSHVGDFSSSQGRRLTMITTPGGSTLAVSLSPTCTTTLAQPTTPCTT
jgi:hypothetical protein